MRLPHRHLLSARQGAHADLLDLAARPRLHGDDEIGERRDQRVAPTPGSRDSMVVRAERREHEGAAWVEDRMPRAEAERIAVERAREGREKPAVEDDHARRAERACRRRGKAVRGLHAAHGEPAARRRGGAGDAHGRGDGRLVDEARVEEGDERAMHQPRLAVQIGERRRRIAVPRPPGGVERITEWDDAHAMLEQQRGEGGAAGLVPRALAAPSLHGGGGQIELLAEGGGGKIRQAGQRQMAAAGAFLQAEQAPLADAWQLGNGQQGEGGGVGSDGHDVRVDALVYEDNSA